MYRITQSFLIRKLEIQLSSEGWIILYCDFPEGRRSGAGNQGKVNICLEKIFDQFPDIIAEKNDVLYLIEVDVFPKPSYVTKLDHFISKEGELLSCLEKMLMQKFDLVSTGLAFSRIPTFRISPPDKSLWIYNQILQTFEKIK